MDPRRQPLDRQVTALVSSGMGTSPLPVPAIQTPYVTIIVMQTASLILKVSNYTARKTAIGNTEAMLVAVKVCTVAGIQL